MLIQQTDAPRALRVDGRKHVTRRKPAKPMKWLIERFSSMRVNNSKLFCFTINMNYKRAWKSASALSEQYSTHESNKCKQVQECLHICAHTHVLSCTHADVCICTHTHTHAHVQMYTRTHVRAHAHANACAEERTHVRSHHARVHA